MIFTFDFCPTHSYIGKRPSLLYFLEFLVDADFSFYHRFSSLFSRTCFLFCIFSYNSAYRPKFSLTAFTLALFKRPMSNPPATVARRSRPSMASYLRDSDEPILVATTFPKKARPTEPPTSLRTTSTSSHPSSTSTSTAISFPSSDSTPNSDRPLVGLLVKLNGEEIPFLIPRPTRPFRLPEAKP